MTQMRVQMGRRVVTFDSPGAFRSTRTARVALAEMLECVADTLTVCDIAGPLDLIGHSVGGLCALMYALDHPERVRRLVLIGNVSGGAAALRAHGFPQNWRWYQPDFWRTVYLGLRLAQGWENLALHKKMLRLIARASYVNPALIPRIEIKPGDNRQPAPIRDRWPMTARRLDYGLLADIIRISKNRNDSR